jgi:glyoxylase-like metal-dependent hydrolase (beta-lactamase superfamily II)
MALKYLIGDLEIVCVSDGTLKSSLDYVIGMTTEDARRVAGSPDDGSLIIPVNNFVFERENARILIDAGTGNTLQPTLGKLPGALREAGYPPESITHVLLTHLHPDHSDGLVDEDLNAVFPNAMLLLHEKEYQFWTQPSEPSETAHVRKRRARNQLDIGPYLDRLKLMRDGETHLGCSPILIPGHTPGHTCWRIDTGGQDLMAFGDLVHFSAIQFPFPETAVKYDLDPGLARETRLRLLDQLATHGSLVAGAHVTAPGLGTVVRDGAGYRFVPARNSES